MGTDRPGTIDLMYRTSRARPLLGATLVLTAFASVVLAPESPLGATSFPCGPTWQIVPAPDPNQGGSPHAVTAVSPTDVWAVGRDNDQFVHTLALHWDGEAWTRVPSPTELDSFEAVDAVASDDAWAVGFAGTEMAAHWDGTAWTPSHIGFGGYPVLLGVDALAHDDVWAVGRTETNQPLIIHWDGSGWSRLSAPRFRHGATLAGISAVAPDDIWVVGYRWDPNFRQQAVILHWDGAAWRVMPSPPAGERTELTAVATLSSDDVWAVGYVTRYDPDTKYRTLIEHWDGSSWSIVPSPSPGAGQKARLRGVAAQGPNDVWAVGDYYNDFFYPAESVLILHWDGASWSTVPGDNSGDLNQLNGIDVLADYRWAVGATQSNSQGDTPHTLIEDSCGW